MALPNTGETQLGGGGEAFPLTKFEFWVQLENLTDVHVSPS